MNKDSPAASPEGGRFGFVHLVPGVSTSNVLALLWASFVASGLLTFVKTIQPYLFNVNLALAPEIQGTVSGQLEFMQEIVVLLTIGLFGALADRIGRRPVFAIGFLLLGAGYVLFPHAGSVPELLAYRLLFALGCAAVGGMLATVLSDYPQDRSRVSLTALVYFLNGLGVILFAVLLANLPQWFRSAGASPEAAGRDALYAVAAIAIVSALLMRALKPGVPSVKAERRPILALLREGIAAGRSARILLAYGTAFASRADIAAVGTFTILWGVQAGIAQGLTNDQATTRAGLLTAVIQGAALLWGPIWAWITRRLDRTTAVVLAMLLAAVGYFAFGSVDDPLASASIPAAVALGIGQMSAILSSQVLIAGEAPEATRGSVLGVYGFAGALGILIISLVGGRLFDTWTPGAPFLLMAGANIALFVWAIAVKRRAPMAAATNPVG